MQFTPWDNPMGTDGFEFVEYAAPDPAALGQLFESMGFKAIAKHRHKSVTLYRQGGINFIINAEPDSFAQRFARQHGPSICAIAFRVKDAAAAYQRAVELGAWGFDNKHGPMERNHPAIQGTLTGLKSKAMTSPCGKIRIPINESSDDKSQIAEYLDVYHGEGIQHIALGTDDIYRTVEGMKAAKVVFQDTIATYYDLVDK